MGEEHIKYGHYRGGDASVPVKLAASQALKQRSGRFVYIDSSGNAVIADDGANKIFGHLEESERTSSSTAGAEQAKCVIDPTAIFRIPVGAGTYVAAMRDKYCDIIKDSNNIQGADLSASSDKVLRIVDGDLVNNAWVDVMLNTLEAQMTGV